MYSTNTKINVKFGEIWMCQLNNNNSVQTGYRPVLVISNNMNNTYSPTLNVIPLTTKMNKRKLPIHVELWDYTEYGLRKPSTLLIEQITTISIDSLDKYIGRIDDKEVLAQIWTAISIQFPILQSINV